MAVAVEMGEDRHARILLQRVRPGSGRPRDDHVDGAVQPCEHMADGGRDPSPACCSASVANRPSTTAAAHGGPRSGPEVRSDSETRSAGSRRCRSLRQSAPASAVTLGRLSKITPMDPERRRHALDDEAVGAGEGRQQPCRPDSAARPRPRTPFAMPSRARFIQRQSVDEGGGWPLALASATSSALAARMAAASARRAAAAARRASARLVRARQHDRPLGGAGGAADLLHQRGDCRSRRGRTSERRPWRYLAASRRS